MINSEDYSIKLIVLDNFPKLTLSIFKDVEDNEMIINCLSLIINFLDLNLHFSEVKSNNFSKKNELINSLLDSDIKERIEHFYLKFNNKISELAEIILESIGIDLKAIDYD